MFVFEATAGGAITIFFWEQDTTQDFLDSMDCRHLVQISRRLSVYLRRHCGHEPTKKRRQEPKRSGKIWVIPVARKFVTVVSNEVKRPGYAPLAHRTRCGTCIGNSRCGVFVPNFESAAESWNVSWPWEIRHMPCFNKPRLSKAELFNKPLSRGADYGLIEGWKFMNWESAKQGP